MLVFGQSAVLVHSIEHPYFAHKDTCTLCQFGQQDKSAVPVPTFFLPPCKQEFSTAAFVLPIFPSRRADHYRSRAPPAFC